MWSVPLRVLFWGMWGKFHRLWVLKYIYSKRYSWRGHVWSRIIPGTDSRQNFCWNVTIIFAFIQTDVDTRHGKELYFLIRSLDHFLFKGRWSNLHSLGPPLGLHYFYMDYGLLQWPLNQWLCFQSCLLQSIIHICYQSGLHKVHLKSFNDLLRPSEVSIPLHGLQGPFSSGFCLFGQLYIFIDVFITLSAPQWSSHTDTLGVP